MPSSTRRGSRWFASWLRQRRECHGWSRRTLVRRSARGAEVLTLPIVQDLERADRLPTWARAHAIAAAFGLPAWTVIELVRLAGDLEPGWERLRGGMPTGERIELSRHLHAVGRDAEAAACAELALREMGWRDGSAAELAFARAVIGLGGHELARWHAEGVLERRGDVELHAEAFLVAAEAAIAAGRAALAEALLSLAERDGGLASREQAARSGVVRAQRELAAGRPKAAADEAIAVIDALARGSREHRAAAECIVSALERQGKPAQARRWSHRMLDAVPPAPPMPDGVAGRRLGD